jgi:hypothetical protein
MSYRTKRPRLRTILTFGAGATLAIMQLGAGCVPADRSRRCMSGDATADESGECASEAGPGASGADGGSDGK